MDSAAQREFIVSAPGRLDGREQEKDDREDFHDVLLSATTGSGRRRRWRRRRVARAYSAGSWPTWGQGRGLGRRFRECRCRRRATVAARSRPATGGRRSGRRRDRMGGRRCHGRRVRRCDGWRPSRLRSLGRGPGRSRRCRRRDGRAGSRQARRDRRCGRWSLRCDRVVLLGTPERERHQAHEDEDHAQLIEF